MKDVYQSFAQRIKDLREDAGLTQERVAELADISYKHLQAIEGGRRKEIRLPTIHKLAKAFGLEAWELLYPQKPILKPDFLRKVRKG